jgi:hypothetical protein
MMKKYEKSLLVGFLKQYFPINFARIILISDGFCYDKIKTMK